MRSFSPPPLVRDAAGRSLAVRMPRGETYPQMTVEIQPGQMIALDNASFTVLPHGADPAQTRGPTLRATPGRHSVTKFCRFNTDGGTELNKKLTAGPIEVEVVATSPPLATHPAAGSPSR